MDPYALDGPSLHALLHQEGRFLSFLRKRLARPDYAEDILQAAYLKSLERGSQLRSDESVVAWFYALLRHAIVDHYRAVSREAGEAGAALETLESPEEEDLQRSIAECVRVAMRGMRPEDAELIQWVDLENLGVAEAGARLAIPPKLASQRLFRAREALRARLQELCRACTATTCLYCQCPATDEPAYPRSTT